MARGSVTSIAASAAECGGRTIAPDEAVHAERNTQHRGHSRHPPCTPAALSVPLAVTCLSTMFQLEVMAPYSLWQPHRQTMPSCKTTTGPARYTIAPINAIDPRGGMRQRHIMNPKTVTP